MAGAPVPQGHAALRGAGRCTPRMGVAAVITTVSISGEETTQAPTPSHGRASKRVSGENGSIRRAARISKASTRTVKKVL